MDNQGHLWEQNNLCPFHYYLYSITQKVMEENWRNIQYTMTCQQWCFNWHCENTHSCFTVWEKCSLTFKRMDNLFSLQKVLPDQIMRKNGVWGEFWVNIIQTILVWTPKVPLRIHRNIMEKGQIRGRICLTLTLKERLLKHATHKVRWQKLKRWLCHQLHSNLCTSNLQQPFSECWQYCRSLLDTILLDCPFSSKWCLVLDYQLHYSAEWRCLLQQQLHLTVTCREHSCLLTKILS